MLPTSAGEEPATSWSPVGRRIQLSHRGRLKIGRCMSKFGPVLDEVLQIFAYLGLILFTLTLSTQYKYFSRRHCYFSHKTGFEILCDSLPKKKKKKKNPHLSSAELANRVVKDKMFWHHNSYLSITKTYLYNFDTLKPHFYIVKLGFTGIYIIFLISAQKHRYILSKNMKKYQIFLIWKFSAFGGEIFNIFE